MDAHLECEETKGVSRRDVRAQVRSHTLRATELAGMDLAETVAFPPNSALRVQPNVLGVQVLFYG